MKRLQKWIQFPSLLPSLRTFKIVDVIVFPVLIAWLLYIMWQILSGSNLVTELPSSTQIHIDLLQSFAFLLAWTIFVLTITVRVLGKAYDMQFERLTEAHNRNLKQAELGWRMEQHLEGHPDVGGQVSSLETKVNENLAAAAEIDRLREENAELRRENEKLNEEN